MLKFAGPRRSSLVFLHLAVSTLFVGRSEEESMKRTLIDEKTENMTTQMGMKLKYV